MSDSKTEASAQRLSATMDLGLGASAHDAQLLSEGAGKRLVHRYHLIGALIRGETDGLTRPLIDGVIAQRIAAQIREPGNADNEVQPQPANEQALAQNLAFLGDRQPAQSGASRSNDAGDATGDHRADEASDADANQTTSAPRSGWWRTVATFAIAASLVAVAVLVITPVSQPPEPTVAEVQPEVNKSTNTAASAADYERLFADARIGTRWSEHPAESSQFLNMLLVEHGSVSPAFGMNGLSSYARFVSYDTTSRN